MDWVSEQPEFAKFLITARFNIIEGRNSNNLHKNKSRNQKIFSLISNFEEFKAFSLIPHELLLSLVIGSTESYCRAWLSQRVKADPKDYRNSGKSSLEFITGFAFRTLIASNKKPHEECGFRLKMNYLNWIEPFAFTVILDSPAAIS